MTKKTQNRVWLNAGWRWIAIVALAASLASCASSGGSPRSILSDPGYLKYQRAVDELDQEYLNKKMTYAEYKERKQQLDARYQRTTVGEP
jgi:hypothetical protein